MKIYFNQRQLVGLSLFSTLATAKLGQKPQVDHEALTAINEKLLKTVQEKERNLFFLEDKDDDKFDDKDGNPEFTIERFGNPFEGPAEVLVDQLAVSEGYGPLALQTNNFIADASGCSDTSCALQGFDTTISAEGRSEDGKDVIELLNVGNVFLAFAVQCPFGNQEMSFSIEEANARCFECGPMGEDLVADLNITTCGGDLEPTVIGHSFVTDIGECLSVDNSNGPGPDGAFFGQVIDLRIKFECEA